jgi:hypothetical protein
VRPRYIYRVRPQAPTRYRQWKSQWSSLDGRTMLRSRFLPERDIRYRRERPTQTRPRPEFRDLRRSREGRIWRGRDEILKLRERRDRVGPPPDRGWRDRGDRRGPPEDRGWRQRGERRPPEDRGDRERPAPPREERRDHEERDRGWKDREDRDRGNRDHSNRGGREDRGERDNGRHARGKPDAR